MWRKHQERPTSSGEQDTDEFIASLPKDLRKVLRLDPYAHRPLYPPGGLYINDSGDYAPDPACYGNDWRLLAPPESKAYKEAMAHPKGDEDDGSFLESIQFVLDSLDQAIEIDRDRTTQ